MVDKWRLKAQVQRVLSGVPGGNEIYYNLQRHVTHSLPIPDHDLRQSVAMAHRHLEVLRREGKEPITSAKFFEFGGGWDLHVPIIFCGSGASDQTVVDLSRLVRVDLVQECLERLSGLLDEEEASAIAALRDGLQGVTDLSAITKRLGITYEAPADARSTGLADGSIDYITSTSTLEHIPPVDISLILKECHRIMRVGGIVSMVVDYSDHYSHFDKAIGPYNFLQFSDREWKRYNPSFHFQNRLRHSQLVALVEASGFDTVEIEPVLPTEEDVQRIRDFPLAGPFRELRPEDVAIRTAQIILRRG
jgi:SAM-dependent methyltransferase